MIRAQQNPFAVRAGILSVLVHIVLLALLLVSFNWKSVQPVSVTQVELWDSLPQPKPVEKPIEKPVESPPEPPKPVIKEEPKPEPPPEPKAEIQIKKKPVVEPKKEKPVEKPKPEQDQKALEAQKKKLEEEKLKKLQQELLAEDSKVAQQEHNKEAQAAANAQAAAALKGELDKYITLVSSKIRPFVNKQLCGAGKPELTYDIALLPTGELSGPPRLVKGSGMPACDDAVERAIRQANPLPRPSAELMPQVREMRLKFRPNEDG